MALLYRTVRIDDRGGTHVFSFVVTRTVTRELHRDLTTKEFPYGFHRWAVMFSRCDKQLGVYLVWRSVSEALSLYVDFAFSLLSRHHFSENESFSGKQISFGFGSPAQGNRRFIAIASLCENKFADVNGEFQLELTMTNLRTILQVSWPLASVDVTEPLESATITYGGFDWKVNVGECEDRVRISLRQMRATQHRCRLRYTLRMGDKASDRNANHSGVLDEIVSEKENTAGWSIGGTLSSQAVSGKLTVNCDLSSASGISELSLPLADNADLALCQDRDLQSWGVQTDTHGSVLRIRLVFKDVSLIPRNHLRCSSWNVYLVRRHPRGGFLSPSLVAGGPFCCYYAQEASDEGILVDTDVPVKELSSAGSLYVDDHKNVTVQIEWLESVLLFQSTYHKYDDINRMHNFQMRREISALQSENFSLERQLFSYQKSIAYANSRGTYSDEVPSPPEHPPGQLSTAVTDSSSCQMDNGSKGAASATSCYVRQLHNQLPEAPFTYPNVAEDNDYNA